MRGALHKRILTVVSVFVVGGALFSLLPQQEARGGFPPNNTTTNLCPGNCSGQGTCVDPCPYGTLCFCQVGQPCPPPHYCVCDPLYTGPDCSIAQEIKCYDVRNAPGSEKLESFSLPTYDSIIATNSTVKHPEYVCDVVTTSPFVNRTIVFDKGPTNTTRIGLPIFECLHIDDDDKFDDLEWEVGTTLTPPDDLTIKKAKLLCAPGTAVPTNEE